MRNLKSLSTPRNFKACQPYIDEPFTIFEKIEFSNFSKERLLAKISDLETRQVPQRTVLMTLSDEEVTEYWFKNWLHPDLKHFFMESPKDKRGCSQKVREQDSQMGCLRTYENGQQNYQYTLKDIKDYCQQSTSV